MALEPLISALTALEFHQMVLHADDEEHLIGKQTNNKYLHCTYLVSYIWCTTKENKWDSKNKTNKQTKKTQPMARCLFIFSQL
jgi:hypothetical protein